MTVTKLAGTLVRESTALAYAAARHPIATTAGALGLARGVVKGAVGVGHDLLHGHQPHHVPEQAEPASEEQESSAAPEPQETEDLSPIEEERADLPGPDLFVPPPTDPDDLPEPIVITAEDAEPGEEFHTEPKAASRLSAHEGLPGDREEALGYVEEIPDPEEQPGLQG